MPHEQIEDSYIGYKKCGYKKCGILKNVPVRTSGGTRVKQTWNSETIDAMLARIDELEAERDRYKAALEKLEKTHNEIIMLWKVDRDKLADPQK